MTDHPTHGTVIAGEGCDALRYARATLADRDDYEDEALLSACETILDRSTDTTERRDAERLRDLIRRNAA